MREVITKVYTFNELNEAAKAKALDACRDYNVSDDWYSFVIEDAQRIGALMGFANMEVSFSGFWSQGDGARFDANYAFEPYAARKVKGYAPKDEALHGFALRLEALQKRNGRKLEGVCARTVGGMTYEHSGWMDCEITRTDEREVSDADAKEFREVARAFADWIYRMLEKDYDANVTDEAVRETIEANEYEFTEDGGRA